MKKKLFTNGVTEAGKEQQREYELFATLSGVRAVPIFVLTDREIKLTYTELIDNTSIKNEEELLERINQLLLEVNGKETQIILKYDFERDRGNDRLRVILSNNSFLSHQFDSE